MDWDLIEAAPARIEASFAREVVVPVRWVAAGFAAGCLCMCALEACLRRSASRPKPRQLHPPQAAVALYPAGPSVASGTIAGADADTATSSTTVGLRQRHAAQDDSDFAVPAASDAVSALPACSSALSGPTQASQRTDWAASPEAEVMQLALQDTSCRAAVERAEYRGAMPANSNATLLIAIAHAPARVWTVAEHDFVMNCKRKLAVVALHGERVPGLPEATSFLDELYVDMHKVLKMRMKAVGTDIKVQKESRAVAAHMAQQLHVRPHAQQYVPHADGCCLVYSVDAPLVAIQADRISWP